MNGLKESLVANREVLLALTLLIVAMVLWRAVRFLSRREVEANKVDRVAQWRELFRRLSDATVTSGLEMRHSELKPFGGEILVMWKSNKDSQKVLSVYFPSEDHPPGRTRLVSSYGRTDKKMVRGYSPNGFHAFVDHLEKIIGDYKSPLAEGDHKPIKL